MIPLYIYSWASILSILGKTRYTVLLQDNVWGTVFPLAGSSQPVLPTAAEKLCMRLSLCDVLQGQAQLHFGASFLLARP